MTGKMKKPFGGYSRFVTYLKIALPLVAIILLGTVFFVTSPDDFAGSGIDFSDADRSALQDGLHIVNPTISGETKNLGEYVFRARTIFSNANVQNLIAAEKLSGIIYLPDGRVIDLSGETATIDLKSEAFHLTGGAFLSSSDGHTVRTGGLLADFKNGILTSDGSIEADGPFGHIWAGSMTLIVGEKNSDSKFQNGVIMFSNGVKFQFLASGR